MPHHADTLAVGQEWYAGLISCALATLAHTVPAEAEAERALWATLDAELATCVAEAAAW